MSESHEPAQRAGLQFDDVAVIDNHCHPPFRDQKRMPVERWRRCFTEGPAPELAALHVPESIYYQAALRLLAQQLGCEPEEARVLEARNRFAGDDAIVGYWLRAARLGALLVDDGYPPPALSYAYDRLSELAGVPARRILRLEVLMQDLILASASWDEYLAAYTTRLAEARAQGVVAFKSIVAYRTGLQIERFREQEAADAFKTLRAAAAERGTIRIASKPLIDYCLHLALQAAARVELPFQFHTGYGDPDTDLLQGNPLLLRDLFETPAYRSVPIVLLHESYPYTRQSGYLAVVYPNAYLDLSYAVPFLNWRELLAMTHQALGVAPTSKLLVSSDASGLPELVYIGATRARSILAQALFEVVQDGELSLVDARRYGEAILRDNAIKLYRLT